MITMIFSVFWNSLIQQIPQPEAVPVPVAEVVEIKHHIVKEYIGEVTAYTSRKEETDDTPFIAANGESVHWGMVATNAYPFGTELRFPQIYGDKVFVVKDRMHSRYQNRVDIWFPDYTAALRFGRKATTIEVVKKTTEGQLSMK